MNTPLFIARRLAFSRQKSIARFIIRLAMAATAVSVASMILTLAFVNGFQYSVAQKVYSFWGQLRVQQYQPGAALITEEAVVRENEAVEKLLSGNAQVASFRRFATKSAVVDAGGEIEGVLLKGVNADYTFDRLNQFLQAGRWPAFSDSSYSRDLVISQHTAKQLALKVKDEVRLVFIDPSSGSSSVRKMQVCGIYKTGIEQYDNLFAIGDLRLIQRVNQWDSAQFGGYEVFLKTDADAAAFNERLFRQLPDTWNSKTMEELFPNIFDWLNIMNTNRNVIFTVMSIVAIINLLTCLLILVLERTRMIGVLKAIGASNGTVQWVFILHAGFVSLFGIGFGLVAGLGICWLQQTTGFITLDESAYYLSRAEVRIVWWQVAVVCVGTLAVCLLSLLAPSLIVRTVQPAKAVQFR